MTKVSLRLVGPSKRKPGLVFALRAHGGTVTGLLVKVRRGHKVLARASVAKLGKHARRLTLPLRRAGHYLVIVTQGPATLAVLKLHLR